MELNGLNLNFCVLQLFCVYISSFTLLRYGFFRTKLSWSKCLRARINFSFPYVFLFNVVLAAPLS